MLTWWNRSAYARIMIRPPGNHSPLGGGGQTSAASWTTGCSWPLPFTVAGMGTSLILVMHPSHTNRRSRGAERPQASDQSVLCAAGRVLQWSCHEWSSEGASLPRRTELGTIDHHLHIGIEFLYISIKGPDALNGWESKYSRETIINLDLMMSHDFTIFVLSKRFIIWNFLAP